MLNRSHDKIEFNVADVMPLHVNGPQRSKNGLSRHWPAIDLAT